MPNRPPGPPLIDPVDLHLPGLPEPLAGLRLLHVTDPHIRRPRRRLEILLESARQTEIDLLLMTGDLMHLPGHEPNTADYIARLIEAAAPRLATVGAPGNHDTADLHQRLTGLPATWLHNEAWACDGLPLTVTGLHYDRTRNGDLVAALMHEQQISPPSDPPRFRLLLAHSPNWLPAAARVGFDLVLSGHTHGGQVRLPGGRALDNNCDWPLRLSSGVMRQGRTTMVLSRGLGETVSQLLRLNCPPHAPLITLHPGSDESNAVADRVELIERW